MLRRWHSINWPSRMRSTIPNLIAVRVYRSANPQPEIKSPPFVFDGNFTVVTRLPVFPLRDFGQGEFS